MGDFEERVQNWVTRLMAAEKQNRDMAYDFSKVLQKFDAMRETFDKHHSAHENANELANEVTKRVAETHEQVGQAHSRLEASIAQAHSRLDSGTRDLEKRFETYDHLIMELDARVCRLGQALGQHVPLPELDTSHFRAREPNPMRTMTAQHHENKQP